MIYLATLALAFIITNYSYQAYTAISTGHTGYGFAYSGVALFWLMIWVLIVRRDNGRSTTPP